MKAIIVAAGKGSRLYPLTKDVPKPLLKVNDKTILERQIQSLRECNINDIVIVTGYLADKIEELRGLDIKCIYNPFYEITNSLVSLWFARGEMSNAFIYLHGDVLFDKCIVDDLLALNRDICLVVDRKSCVEEDMKVKVKGDLIAEINKTMPLSEAYGEFIGIAKFSPEGSQILSKALDAIVREGDLMLWFESAIQRLIDEGYRVYKCDIRGKPWIEIDYPEDLEQARKTINPAIECHQAVLGGYALQRR